MSDFLDPKEVSQIMKTHGPIMLLFLVLSVSLACSILQPAESPDLGAVETQVAATFTAMASGESPVATSTPPVGDTPTDPPGPEPETTAEPVGLRVVYVKDNTIYLWQEGEAPKAISRDGNPIYSLDLSDDGQVIAFNRQTGDVQAELWAVNIDGSNERLLVSEQDFKAYDPDALAVVPYHFSWVPGSHILAYNTNQIFEGPNPGLYNDLRLVDADSLIQTTLLEPGQGGEFNYSPDGSQIAIVTPTTISLINADGSNLRPAVLEYEPVLTYSEYQYYAEPQWLSDSSSLKVMIPPVDSLSEPRPPTSLWEIPLDGSPAVKTGEIVMMPFFTDSAAFSPDLTKIAYLIETGEPAQNIHKLHFANPDGSDDRVYHAEPLLNFRGWAKDGMRFALTVGEDRALQLGHINTAYSPADDLPRSVFRVDWIDDERYLYLQDGGTVANLYLAGISSAPVLLDEMPDAFAPFDHTIDIHIK
jgi:dipeptidyl aminopeptidase/acylaminoacyl peptidase